MQRLYLFITVLFFLSSHIFSQEMEGELYDKDEWEEEETYCSAHRLLKLEGDEDEKTQEKIDTHSQRLTAHPLHLSKMYLEGAFYFDSTLAKQSAMQKIGKKRTFNWATNVSSYLASSYYEIFARFKSDKEQTVSFETASLRFSPLLMYHPPRRIHGKAKFEPLLSFYIGRFITPLSFKHLGNISFGRISSTSIRRTHPSINNIKLSKTKGDLGVATEVALPFFNFYFFWKNAGDKKLTIKNIKKNHNDFNLYLAYKNTSLMASRAKMVAALLARFIEMKEERNDKQEETNKRKHSDNDFSSFAQSHSKDYSHVYAVEFNFAHPHVFFNSLNGGYIVPKERFDAHSLACRQEAGFAYKIFKLNAGFSYEGGRYSTASSRNKEKNERNRAKSNKERGDIFAFYLQEKLKWRIFSASHSYSLIKKTQNKNIEHSNGFFYSIGNSLILFKNELLLNKELYTVKFAFSSHPHIPLLKSFILSSHLNLQDKRINPHVIKKYEVGTTLVFELKNDMYLKVGSRFAQSSTEKQHVWKQGIYELKTSFLFQFSQEKWKEKGIITLKYSTDKNRLGFSAKMRLEY